MVSVVKCRNPISLLTEGLRRQHRAERSGHARGLPHRESLGTGHGEQPHPRCQLGVGPYPRRLGPPYSPIIVNTKMQLVDGAARVRAAMELGLE